MHLLAALFDRAIAAIPALDTGMVTGLLVFARCAGFVFRAPGFSHPSVPARAAGRLRAGARRRHRSGARETPARIGGAAFVAALLAEFLLGGAIGMTASLIYDGAYAGGRVVDDYVGVKAIAPSLQLVAPSGFGRVWSLAFTGGFFLTRRLSRRSARLRRQLRADSARRARFMRQAGRRMPRPSR